MEPLHQRTFNLLLIGIAGGIVVLAFGARWYVDSLETTRQANDAARQNEIAAQLTQMREKISVLEHATGALVAQNQTVAKQLADEQSKRVAAEVARAASEAQARQQIAALQEDLTSSKAPNLAAVVSDWRPRVAQLFCTWRAQGIESSGSGVLLLSNPATVVTNKHVLTYNGAVAEYCTVKFPNDAVASIAYTGDIVTSDGSSDWAKVTIRKPTPYIASLTATPPRCSAKPAAGDSVVILGYPTVGAQGDITATEGIISGFEGNYFISSAKVERGNSGGAAILTKQNCYLGIPSYVGAGQLETLARILDQHVIFQ